MEKSEGERGQDEGGAREEQVNGLARTRHHPMRPTNATTTPCKMKALGYYLHENLSLSAHRATTLKEMLL